MAKLGFIGLGTMGRPMARNLLRAGHSLTFYARRDDVAREFVEAGGLRAASPAEVCRVSDTVFTIVTADAEVIEVAVGRSGLIEAAAPGKTLVDMSTIAPATVRRVAERLGAAGMAMLDAPVSGGPSGAAAATLCIMVGGEAAVYDRSQELLRVLGSRIFHVGPLGAGQTVKLVNQLLGGGILALIGEGLTLAKAAGVDLAVVADVIESSTGNSVLFQGRARKYILGGEEQPGFATQLMRKDLGLVLDLAARLNVPLPATAAVFQQYTQAMNQGHAGHDFSSVARVCARAANVDLRQPPVASTGPQQSTR
jgi:2-hydroxy-3-oxopropionate reductase